MKHDIVVVGAGHAGCEAAAAAARRGAAVALLLLSRASLGSMSCNPAIGGIGKGHIVREVDALDGIIGRAADTAAIHYRMLNRSKGLAVHGPRIQADRRRYARAVEQELSAYPTIDIIEGEVVDLVFEGDRVAGVLLSTGETLQSRAVILASGTFLGGRLFRGDERRTGGRDGEGAATRLADRLRDLDLPLARLKTGTPPRLDGCTIDWSRLPRQESDREEWTMSPLGRRGLPQVHCAVTRTTEQAHDIIRAAFDRSPLYSGDIAGAGPRYCPSIEDKVRRFGDRDGHQIFLEPEGLDTRLIYPNGISTSLPADVQVDFVRAVPGLERVEIDRPGYAVEYDHLDPRLLDHRLALRGFEGLFCAGQINGTTGYEEAAGQGLVAGANAAAHALGLAPFELDRSQSYIGVMIDDLVLSGVTEPYRMMTARAEHRLHLRADNATTRLSGQGTEAGLLREARRAYVRDRNIALRNARDGTSAADDVRTEVEADRLYAPYVERQRAEYLNRQKAGQQCLHDVDYHTVPGLSLEMTERLERARPETIAHAERVPGVTPAALAAVLVHAQKHAA